MKTTMKTRLLILSLLFILSSVDIFSQVPNNKKLEWEIISVDNPMENVVMENTEQIIEWANLTLWKDGHPEIYETVRGKNAELFIIYVIRTFGLYSPHVYVFLKENDRWCLKAITQIPHANGKIRCRIQNGKILFEAAVYEPVGYLSLESILSAE